MKIKAQTKKQLSTILILKKKWLSKLYFNLKIICLSKTRKANNSMGTAKSWPRINQKVQGKPVLVWEEGMALR